MGFATFYLERNSLFKPFIQEEPSRDINLIVVIPSLNEPDILTSLNSLYKADRPSTPVEVIVAVNSPEKAPADITGQNIKTLSEVKKWGEENNTDDFAVYAIDVPPFARKHAGAGFARKAGMDEAVYRFNTAGNENGIIVSFDADSSCDTNYLTEIEKCFSDAKRTGCHIYYEHPLQGDEHPEIVYDAITGYELFLRYFPEAMRLTGFPWPFHTVGSCFAVSSKVYAAQGGMNRRTAGEDFYFLHKIFPLGNFTELNTTRVIPSPRISDRVPFGTGATISRFASGIQSEISVWPLESFDDLTLLFNKVPLLFRADEGEIHKIAGSLTSLMKNYLAGNGFMAAVVQMNAHSSNYVSFRKRFFTWFNAFRLLKYLNYARDMGRSDLSVGEAASRLLLRLGRAPLADQKGMLLQYRDMQRSNVWNS